MAAHKYTEVHLRLIGIWVRRHSFDMLETFGPLISGGFLEPGHQFSGHLSAVLHVGTVRLGPLTNLGGVQLARRRPASTAGGPPGITHGPAGRTHIARQRFAQRRGLLGVQVDLLLRAVQREADSPFSLAAIQVIDEQACIF